MQRWRRLWWSGLLACLLSLCLVPGTFAGGWAIVVLDHVPEQLQAGQSATLGMMVLQHGVTPVDSPYGQGPSMVVTLLFQNQATGEVVRVPGRQEGAVGHFVVDFTVPAAGVWKWQVTPGPFQATQLGTITIQPAGTSHPASMVRSAIAPARLWLGGVGVALLLTAAVVLLAGRLRQPGEVRRPALG